MNNLTQRIITAAIGATIMIGGILWNDYSLCAVLFILSLAVHFEYIKSVQQFKGDKRNIGEWILILVMGCFLFYWLASPESLSIPGIHLIGFGIWRYGIFNYTPIFLIIIISSFVIYELFARRQSPFQNIGLNITGIFYCVMPFALLMQLSVNLSQINIVKGIYPNLSSLSLMNDPFTDGKWFILGYFLIVWSNDSFAYFAGKLFGKHKLFERISPHKTWEGFFGGMIASLICAFALSCFVDILTRADWIVIALIITVFGTIGDLVESMLKRSLHIKDSSSILPGHGGFLDRFDATLIAAPVVFAYLMMRI